MNLENEGQPMFKIVNGSNDKNSKTVYFEPDKNKLKNPLEDYTCTSNETTQLLPNSKRERDVLYIAGQSGSGKSYFASKWLKEYCKIYKDRTIYLFSSVEKDDQLDKITRLKRVKLNEKFLSTPLQATDFKDSCCIFDDCDVIRNKQLKQKVWNILNMLLQTGRHQNCSVIQISHVINAGCETRIILNESHSITIFPRTLGARNLKYLLENYLGYDKHQINQIKKIGRESRAVTFIKSYPNVVLYDKGALIMDTLKDS